jgi:S1-C subfamily serine protease
MKLFLGILLFLTQATLGQTYNYPKCNSQADQNLKIVKVTRGDYSTKIDFEYVRSEAQGIYILLYSPNTDGAYYIKVGGKIYKLTSTNGIGNVNGITSAQQYIPVYFSATFEAIPKTVNEFDLIEGSKGSWHFYGVQLNNEQTPTTECDNIQFYPMSSKPDFKTMLAGVKYAVILNKPKINGHVPAFNALVEYLQGMGFETIEYLSEDNEQPRNLCEVVFVEIGFQYDLEKFFNISMAFANAATGYNWEFSTKKIARAGLYSNPKNTFGQALRDMYGYTKGSFNSYYTMQLPKRQTCWTEAKIKSYIRSNGCDKIEGIYENTASSLNESKYRVAVRKLNGIYYLIYLSGAHNTGNWSEGEIKATLEPTATPLFYKAKWIMSDKSENSNYYITFEQGLFNMLSDDNEKQLYIKMFPSSTDNIANTPSEGASSGTGYAISSNGYIVTNHHVTNGANSIKIRGVYGDFSKTYTAKVIIEDKNNDLSIIKIDDPNFTSLGTIPYIITNRASDVGSSVFVLGYPLRATMGDEVKLTNGIISSKSGFQGDVTSYQITAPVQPGNSGGPLFDDKGNIIGIINAKHVGAENASYAIKSSYLMNLIDLMPTPPKLQTISTVAGKPLTEQVKILKKFTYIIEIN